MKTKLLISALLYSSITLANDGLPNPELTPGALNPHANLATIKSTICLSNYSKTIRPPATYTNKLKLAQIKQYQYADTNPKDYEEDHLLPISLGGNPTDPKNLWPEPRIAEWDSQKKDILESFIHREVCKGNISLEEAQEGFMTNWVLLYQKYESQFNKVKLPSVD